MGIKHFYSWFRRHEQLKNTISYSTPQNIEHLLIDMNGIIHEAAQKTYKYGLYEVRPCDFTVSERMLKHVWPSSATSVAPSALPTGASHPLQTGLKTPPSEEVGTGVLRASPHSQKEEGLDPSIKRDWANSILLEKQLFETVKQEVNKIVKITNPIKTIFLAIDGVAPRSKQNQQRQRRFKAAREKTTNGGPSAGFDSTCITAGTSFMSRLSDYITPLSWIINERHPCCEIILSNDKIPGEGEHKLINWIRNRGGSTDGAVGAVGGREAATACDGANNGLRPLLAPTRGVGSTCGAAIKRFAFDGNINDESFVVVGVDADLILLCLCLEVTNVWLMREQFNSNILYHKRYDWINIKEVKTQFQKMNITPVDLVIWSCFIGNDFLPPIPSLEIKESPPEQGALDFFIDILGKKETHQALRARRQHQIPNFSKDHNLFVQADGGFNINNIVYILQIFSKREEQIMKARKQEEAPEGGTSPRSTFRFPNPLWMDDIHKYRQDHFEKKLVKTGLFDPLKNSEKQPITRSQVAFDYMKTVFWVYKYYTSGVVDWDWAYPYTYGLHASELVEHFPQTRDYQFSNDSKPCSSDEQLLRVVPYESKEVVPKYLWEKLKSLNSNIKYSVDITGKRYLWEGLPIICKEC